jgi:hypothetical protein
MNLRQKRMVNGFLLGLLIGSWIPFTIEQLLYRDEFGVINLRFGDRATLLSSSPDRSIRIIFVELGILSKGLEPSLNFELRLQRKADISINTIYKSPDLPYIADSARVVWSRDNSSFILVANNFELPASTDKIFELRNGEKVFLLYDVKTNNTYYPWCSAITSVCNKQFPREIFQKFQQDGLL